jgi:hypothetical protein
MRKIKRRTSEKRWIERVKQSELPIFCSRMDFPHIFSKLMKFREEADYNSSYTFAPEDFAEFKSEAEGVIQKITNYLKSKDYL